MYSFALGLNTLYFFFNDTATTEIYTLSLHDALPISQRGTVPGGAGARLPVGDRGRRVHPAGCRRRRPHPVGPPARSEEHTSELQSRQYLACRHLLEKNLTINSILYNTMY